MKRWQWWLQQTVIALDIAGLAGLAMIVVAGVLFFGAIQPAKQEIIKTKQELVLVKSLPQAAPQSTPADELAGFYNFFPPRDALAEQLRMVHQLAAQKKLSIEHVDYKLSKIQGTPLVSYQISFPLNANYANLRHYLTNVLRELPNAALEDIALQRADAETEVLDERVTLVLFFRESS
ncbi:MAG: hypothetical protein LAC70_00250 [Methylovulum sp.]|nr:hypothetical protein [Methylovulum sp.]